MPAERSSGYRGRAFGACDGGLSSLLSDGKRFLVRVDAESSVLTDVGEQRPASVRGEIILQNHGDHSSGRSVSLTRAPRSCQQELVIHDRDGREEPGRRRLGRRVEIITPVGHPDDGVQSPGGSRTLPAPCRSERSQIDDRQAHSAPGLMLSDLFSIEPSQQ
jgi:hypothetical protein